MPKIERRHTVVTLYQGSYDQRLNDLENRAIVARKTEEASGSLRFGQRAESMALAAERDTLREEAEQTAVRVTLWALPHMEWRQLVDEHPPRDDVRRDQRAGANVDTLPDALVPVCMVPPGDDDAPRLTLEERKARGEELLTELGGPGGEDLGHAQWAKLSRAAWNVNTGEDELPKYSLVSLLSQESSSDSEQLPGSE